jgi:hypothetical protein
MEAERHAAKATVAGPAGRPITRPASPSAGLPGRYPLTRDLIRGTATASLIAAVPGTGAIIYGGNPPQVTGSITGSGAWTRG